MITSPGKPAVLLVDDRFENLLALEAVLDPLALRLVRATSGEEALKQVLRNDFAVILLDVQMPGMNGFETAELIKSRERSQHTPIIFLTAISKDEEYVFEGYTAGAVDYIFKPFHPEVLRSKVSVFVDLYRKTQQIREQEQRLRQSELRELELQHRSALWESEERAAQIVDNAMDAIITFGADRRIDLFNAAAVHMFGYSDDEAAQLEIDALIYPPLTDALLQGQENGRPVGEQLYGVRKDGRTFPLEASLSSLDLPEQRVYTVIAHDVTQQQRARQRLREQAAELERAMTTRSRFFASMSHELRTPINAMLGYTALLLDGIYGELSEAQRNSIQRAHKAAVHLLDLVNDVLDLSKIEAGKIELQLESVRFPDLIADLFVTMVPLAEQHETELSMNGAIEPFTLLTDGRRVRQIMLNLLSNAIKFGGGRPVSVVCRRAPQGGVEVEVHDQGRGIAPEDQERIFNEFEQLESTSQGTGLGLPISRRLAELLGGSLTVDSSPGAGSCFRLALPAMTAATVPVPPTLAVEA
jgi:PAS domain S-box-containing protein